MNSRSLMDSRPLLIAVIGAVASAGCSGGSAMDSMMTSYCDLADDQFSLDPHNDGDPAPPIDCNFTKGAPFGNVCRHAGGNWKHNWAADYWGNQLYPDTGTHTAGGPDDYGYGCDARFTTASSVLLDGYIKRGGAQPIVFEMKAADYEGIQAKASCPDTLKQKLLTKLEQDFKDSASKEESVASFCGFRYQMVFSDRTLYRKALDYFTNDKLIDLNICDSCRSAPSVPSDYAVKPMEAPVEPDAFTRFWLDNAGELHSMRLVRDSR